MLDQQPPFWSSIAATAAISGLTGYYLANLLGFNSTLKSWPATPNGAVRNSSPSSDVGSDSEDDGPLPNMQIPDLNEEHKLVLVVRTDLGMGKGKIAAQCSHATLACYKRAQRHMPQVLKKWEYHGQAKIALKCGSEDEILLLQATAISLGLVAEVIHDAGRTQIAAGSATVLGIGPGPKSLVNQVTGHLSLL